MTPARRWRAATACAAAALAVAATITLSAEPATTSSLPWRINAIGAMARAGNTLFLSRLDLVVPRSRAGRGLVVVSADEGLGESIDAVDNALFDTRVDAVIADGAGGWYIGGLFSAVGGLPRQSVAHVLANGRVDAAFDARLESGAKVLALALDGSRLVIGGNFSAASSAPRSNLAVVSASTGALAALSIVPATNGAVSALAVHGTTFFVGGQFSMAGGATRENLAAFNITTGALLAYVADIPVASGASVDVLVVHGGSLFVGGLFDSIKGQARRNLAKLNATTAVLDAAWKPVVNDNVIALAVEGTSVYVGGAFATADGVARRGLAAFDVVSGAVTSWRADTDHVVTGLGVLNGALHVVGVFRTVGGVPRLGAASVSTGATARVLPWNPGVGPLPRQLAVAAGRAAIVGQPLVGSEAVDRDAVVALDLLTGTVLPWASGFVGRRSAFEVNRVSAMVAAGARLIVATASGEQGGGALTAFDLSTRARLPLQVAVAGTIHAMAAKDDIVYVGGDFTSVGGLLRTNLAAIDMATGQVQSWAPTTDRSVRAMTTFADRVIVGGLFTSVTAGSIGRVQRGLVEFTTSGTLTDFNPAIAGSPAAVVALAMDGDTLILGGVFASVKGSSRVNLAAMKTSTSTSPTGTLLPWRADTDGEVSNLSVSRRAVYITGEFATVGGQSRRAVAQVALDSAAVSGWSPALSEGLRIAADDHGVAVVALQGNDGVDLVHFFPEEALAGQPGMPVLPEVRVRGDAVSISWAPPIVGPRPTSYRLEAGTATGLTNLGTLPVGVTRLDVAGVPPGPYFVRVRAVDTAGVGPASTEVSFVVGAAGCTTPPSAPEVSAANVTGSTVQLAWNASAGSPPTNYVVAVGTSTESSTLATIPMGPTTSFVTGGVPAGVYFARVVASNACGASAPSAPVRISVGGAAGPPEAPLHAVSSVIGGTVTLSWQAPISGGPATGHVLEAGSAPGQSNLAAVVLPAARSVTFGSVPPGTYYVRVRASNASGRSPASGEVVLVVP